MFKKLSAVLMVIVLAVSMFSLSAFAEPQKVTFWRIDSSATDYVKIGAANNTGDTVYANLIAVYVNENDKIEALAQSGSTEIANGATEYLTATFTTEQMAAVGSEATLSYYVWDNGTIRTPLENAAPVPSTEVTAGESTIDSVSLSWNDADDDYHGVTSYNVYNMGIFLGNTMDNSFTAVNQERGIESNYSVKSVDDEGAESVQAIAIDLMTKNIPTAISAGDTIITDGRLNYSIDTRSSYYGFSIPYEADGLACRKSVNASQDTYLDGSPIGGRDLPTTRQPYNFSQEYASEIASETKFTFVLTYFDEGTGNITMDYCRVNDGSNPDGLSGSVRMATFTNTKTWKTAVCKITDGNFGLMPTSTGNSMAKLRIYGATKGLRIYSLSMCPTDEFDALMKDSFGRVTDSYINGGVFFSDYVSGETQKHKIDDKGALKTYSLNCALQNADVKAGSSVTVEVEYYTETEDEGIALTYNGGAEIKAVTETGKWQRARFELTGSPFSSNANFSVASTSGEDIYIHSVRAYIPQ